MGALAGGGRAMWILAAILLVGLALRLWGLSFGLPNIHCRPDETTLVYRALAIGAGDPNPHFFNYPSLHFYFLAALYGAYFAFGYLSGHFADIDSFEAQFFADPSAFYLLGRALGALMGAASVWVLYHVGLRLGGRPVGTTSALFLSLCFLHVRDAHFLTVDVPATFYLLVSCVFSLSYIEEKRIRDIAGGAVFLGLAASTKYNLSLCAGIVFVAALYGVENGREKAVRALAILGLMGLAFVAGSPYVLLDFEAFWRDLSYERLHFASGHDTDLGKGWVYHFVFTLPLSLGWPLFIAALLGLGRWAWGRRPAELALLAGALGYYAVAGSGKVVFMRYVMPLLPLLCLAAGSTVAAIGRSSRQMGLLALLLVAPTAWSSWRHSDLLSRTDTRVLAARWIEERVPQGSRIGLCCGSDYGYPQLQLSRSALVARSAGLQRAGFGARRLERRLARAELSPGYDLIEFRATNPSGFDWVWTEYGVERLAREHVGWVVVHEHPLAYSQLDSSFVIALESAAERLQLFDPLQNAQGEAVYDPIDAFYLPVAGFEGIERPGPRIAIYRVLGLPGLR